MFLVRPGHKNRLKMHKHSKITNNLQNKIIEAIEIISYYLSSSFNQLLFILIHLKLY